MAIISKENILKVLTAFNPWWKTGAVNPKMSKTYKRFAFHEAMKRLDQTDIRRTVVLTGTRRVGKTTIQYQMIENALYGPYILPKDVYYFATTPTNSKVWDRIGGHVFCYAEDK